MKKIYYRWSGDCKYEFYIETGMHRNSIYDNPPVDFSHMITINIIGGGKVSNKKGERLKKRLMYPPSNFVIRTGETWCRLSDEEMKHYIELELNEFKKLLETYDISEMRILQ